MIKRKQEFYGVEEHDARFPSEDACRDYLVLARWNGRPVCHYCKNENMNYYISSRKIWKCSSCKKQFRVTKGSIFESSNISLRKWFRAIYFYTTMKRSISSCQLAKLISVEQKTAWFVLMRLREVLRDETDKVLTGIVQVDETYVKPDPGKDKRLQAAKQKHEQEQNEKFGYSDKRKTYIRKQLKKLDDGGAQLREFNAQQKLLAKNGNRTPFRPANAVLGMLSQDEVILCHLGYQYLDTTNNVIVPHLLKNIDLSAEIITDESSFYTAVGKKFKRHRIVRHDVEFVTKDGAHTNGIENCWLHFYKLLDGTYFHLSFFHFYKYLNEHSFRWNIKKLALKEQFEKFTSRIFGKRVSYRDVIIPKVAA